MRPAATVSDTKPASVEGLAKFGPLAEALDRETVVGTLWRSEGPKLRCVACGHRCLIAPGRRGICRVRFNANGELRVPFGYVAAVQSDPVEKKPFFHFHPGSDALTFGMMGCDFHCGYCQNWVTSQALRDPAASVPIRKVTPERLVRTALEQRARLMVSSYNEPLITAEWAVAVFKEAASAGLACAFVSNGNLTPEALEFIRPWIQAYKIDLKSFDDQHYRSLGGTLEKVLEGIRAVHASGLWLEIVTLIIPGFNNSEEELRAIARFLASVSPNIPWHVTAFHRDYKLTEPPNTTAAQLVRAAEIGKEEGLHFVYAGNLPGRVGSNENTNCPGCGTPVVSRKGYVLQEYRVTLEGRCPDCKQPIPGVWKTPPSLNSPRWPRPVHLS